MKRLLDGFLSLFALCMLSPIMVFVAFLLWVINGDAFYCQRRIGIHGRVFMIYKFRTMNNQVNEQGDLLPDSERLTRIGNFLRRLSLDELPQLVNVLKGEMSLVGPRPLLVQYLERYSPEQARRHEVLPGLTGWAQINGRNALSWEEKFKLDVWYVDHQSLWLDVRILMLTLAKVIRREGVSAAGEATMPEFRGSGDSNG